MGASQSTPVGPDLAGGIPVGDIPDGAWIPISKRARRKFFQRVTSCVGPIRTVAKPSASSTGSSPNGKAKAPLST